MVLKALYLQGFKSFPDKVDIQFGQGITAIVGPNGSGKSNISDAIRWVMGEQSSRMLRGARMEDVIFGGTQKRGPVGFAEVSLVIDNSDGALSCEYSEVMVTRRYYRSGESEYYLNRRQVRLRDLHELFMDTGLGRDGYSIIGQGKIDDILSLKSGDRREIFEEAAGITKYRYRKEEAVRKLAATEENLVRIRDILSELEERLGPLEQQARKAQEYLRWRERLQGVECAVWQRSLQTLEEKRSQCAQQGGQLQQQLEQARQQRREVYARLEQLSARMQQLDVDMEGRRRALSQQERYQADQKSRQAVLEESIRNHQQNIERTQQEREQTRTRGGSLSDQLNSRQQQQRSLEGQLEQLVEEKRQLDQRRQEMEQSDRRLGDELTALRRAGDAGSERLGELEREESSLSAALGQLAQREQAVEQELDQLLPQQQEQARLRTAYRTQLEENQEQLEARQNMLAGLELKYKGREQKVQQLERQKNELTYGRDDAAHQLRLLQRMEREMEGFSRAVKLVMKRSGAGLLPGVHGPLSLLLRTGEEYVTAVETALGSAASHLVVDTAEDGRRAIEYLKQEDGGRATFLPLDTIRPSKLREGGLEQLPGFVAVADALVECPDQYRAAVSSVLGRTVVIDRLDHAIAASRRLGQRVRLVTLDGQVINAGGSMTGGSAARSTGALSRRGRMEQLEREKAQLEERLDKVQAQWRQCREETGALQFQMDALRGEIAQAREERARLQAAQDQQRALLDSLEERAEKLRDEREQGAAARRQKQEQLARLQQEKAAVQQQLADNRQAQQTLLAGQEERQQASDRMREEHAQLLARQAALESELEQNQKTMDELDGLRRQLLGDEEQKQRMIEEFTRRLAQDQEQLRQTGQEMEQGEEDRQHIQAEITRLAAQRMELEGKRTRLDQDSQRLTEQMVSLERECAQQQARQEQLEGEHRQMLDQMWERYELTPSTLAQHSVPIDSQAQAEREIALLRGKIRALGNVNLDAVEEYTAVQERFSFLSGQRADVEQAKGELEQTIAGLTEQMKEIFTRQFRLLNQYFGETFTEIFGGGRAELVLEDPSDVLGCGIEIRVCPPGKALKTITLLSGGEKAFVAIALYFAILKVRPAPFCVLDEIEAALDDVNVARFAAYLRRLCGQTQFIVITHRRGTMEQADMLYGVTMQEQGVSKLLMLNINEVEDTLHLSQQQSE